MENENTATAVGIAVSTSKMKIPLFNQGYYSDAIYTFLLYVLSIIIIVYTSTGDIDKDSYIAVFGYFIFSVLTIIYILSLIGFFSNKITDFKKFTILVFTIFSFLLYLFFFSLTIVVISNKFAFSVFAKNITIAVYVIFTFFYFIYYIIHSDFIINQMNLYDWETTKKRTTYGWVFVIIYCVLFPIHLISLFYEKKNDFYNHKISFLLIILIFCMMPIFFATYYTDNKNVSYVFLTLALIILLVVIILFVMYWMEITETPFLNVIKTTRFLIFLFFLVLFIFVATFATDHKNISYIFATFTVIIFLVLISRLITTYKTQISMYAPDIIFIVFILFTAIFYFYLITTYHPNDKKIYNLNFAFGSIFMMIILFYFLYLSSKSKGGLFQEFTKTIFTGFSSFSQCFEYIKKIDTEKLNSMPIYAVIAILLFLGVCIYYVSIDSTFLTNNTFSIAIFISAILLFGFFITTTESNTGLIIGGVFLMIVAMIYFVHNNTTLSNYSLNYVFYIMIFLMIVVGMAMFYGLLKNYLVRQIGLLGFIMNLIFFIPCMLYDLIDYFKNEYKITSSNMLILFIVELVLVISYLYLPKLLSFTTAENSNLLLGEPTFLKHPITISNSKIFRISESDTEDPELFRNNNYSFSFWVFINTSNKELKNILRYSDSGSRGGKPQIMYGNDDKYTDKYVVYFSNNVPTGESESVNSIEMTLNNQKWNFWTINYLDNVCEIYINGYLEKVVSLNNIPKEGSPSDEVKIGDNDGLDGAICNVKYYNKPLSSFEIISMYKKDQMDLITVGFPYSSFSFKQTLSTLGVRT